MTNESMGLSINSPRNRIFKIRRYSYLLGLAPFLLPFIAYGWGERFGHSDYEVFFPLFIIFVVIPLMDFWIGDDKENPSLAINEKLESDNWYTLLLVLVLPLHVFTLFWAASVYSEQIFGFVGQLGWLVSVGVVGSMVGINVGHELVHRQTIWLKNFGGILLASMCYGSFKIEHLRGHHRNVGTEKDASSAKKGQTLYSFIPQAIIKNILCASNLEELRLKKAKLGYWNFHNEFLIWTFVSINFGIVLTYIYGLNGLIFFIGQSLFAILLLETVNYIEHYGLRRQKNLDGRYESPKAKHSWNSSSFLTNMFLFQLQRHSDHHLNASRPYQMLRQIDLSPQLPVGYGALVVFAWVPFIWFRLIHPRLDKWLCDVL